MRKKQKSDEELVREFDIDATSYSRPKGYRLSDRDYPRVAER